MDRIDVSTELERKRKKGTEDYWKARCWVGRGAAMKVVSVPYEESEPEHVRVNLSGDDGGSQ